MSLRKGNYIIAGGGGDAVHLTGNETVSGIKTFTDNIIFPFGLFSIFTKPFKEFFTHDGCQIDSYIFTVDLHQI